MCSNSNIYLHIISKHQAKSLGMKRYFTGKPCKHGHVCERLISSGDCIECKKISKKKDYHSNKEKHREAQRRYYYSNISYHRDRNKNYHENNRELCNQKSKTYYRNNRERLKEYAKKYRDAYKDHYREYFKIYSSQNRGKVNCKNLKRKASKLQRSIPLSEQHQSDLSHIYEQAALLRELGYDVHVDHIIPLQGELVSGLHVPWNLQIISAGENISKSNKFDPYIEIFG